MVMMNVMMKIENLARLFCTENINRNQITNFAGYCREKKNFRQPVSQQVEKKRWVENW